MRRDQAANRRADGGRASSSSGTSCLATEASPIGDLDRRAVRELVERVVDRGSPVMARRLQSHLHRMFQWAAGVDLVESNPIAAMPKPCGETAARPRPDGRRAGGGLAGLRRPRMALRPDRAAPDPDGRAARRDGGRSGGRRSTATWCASAPTGPRTGGRTRSRCRRLRWRSSASVPRRGALVFTTNGETAPSGFSRAKRRLDKLVAGEVAEPFTVHDLQADGGDGPSAARA